MCKLWKLPMKHTHNVSQNSKRDKGSELTNNTAVLRRCIGQIVELVRNEYVPDSPTHDFSHLARVASLSSRICAAEGGNKLIAVSAAWLHDLHREAQAGDGPFFVSPEEMDERVERVLSRAGIPKTVHQEILEAIHYTDRFSFSNRPIYKTTIEAKIVRDADCLDAIGAIGVARAFSFGGAHDISLWNEATFSRQLNI